jgi:S-methylmethionine-dependent homocysteine/selenocysteine methylase
VDWTLIDGPMGTELARRGIALDLPDWTAGALDRAPDIVAAIHLDYAAAGATVHTAATFRTQARTVGRRWESLARKAVLIAREQVTSGHRVAGSLAPLADCYRPDLSPGAGGRAEHRRLAVVLAEAGVDVLLCETFAHPGEAVVAVEECARTGVDTWIALTAGPDATLMTPETMRSAARDCVAAGAKAVLVNCTPATRTLAFVEALAGLEAGLPFGAYANAGDLAEGIGWSADPAAASRAYGRLALEWVAAGATLIGGCCGTGPAHVAELSRLQRVSAPL